MTVALCRITALKKTHFELTASHLELAGVRIQWVVVEHHPAGDSDPDPGKRSSVQKYFP
jgi:hypothetical protein